MATVEHVMTAAELLQTPGLGRCELVRGELILMTPAGFEHGRIVINIGWALKEFVRTHPVGTVSGAETGFHIGHDPDTVRAPDVAFTRGERIPPTPVRGFFPDAPDLAVEVLSPAIGRARCWRKSAIGFVPAAAWCGSSIPKPQPSRCTAAAIRASCSDESDTLTGGEVLAGFSMRVSEIFAS